MKVTSMKPFDLAPDLLDVSPMLHGSDVSNKAALCNELLQRYRQDIRGQLANDEFDIRFLRAISFLIPFLASNVNTSTMRALEIGSGHGAKSIALSHLFAEYVGLELVPDLVRFADDARDKFGCANLSFQIDSAANIDGFLTSSREKFDVIILYAVLEHLTIEEKLETLRACWDHLDDGGYLFIGEAPNRMLPLDLHSTRLLYFQQMPMDLMRYCIDQSINKEWAAHLSQAAKHGNLELSLYRRGIHVGHQELELGLMPMESMRRHIVADSYYPTMLNQYAYLNLEFLKLLELAQLHEFEGRTDIEFRDFPSLFSRYFIEVLLRKGALPAELPDVVVVRPSNRSGFLSTTQLAAGFEVRPGNALTIDGPTGDGPLRVSIEVEMPSKSGALTITTQSGEVIGEYEPTALLKGISRWRKRLVFDVAKVNPEDFPITIAASGSAPATVNFVFLRADRAQADR